MKYFKKPYYDKKKSLNQMNKFFYKLMMQIIFNCIFENRKICVYVYI